MSATYAASGFQMIRQIEIRNFRCFQHLVIPDVRRINIITGDNGSGKTALLEALFVTLASSPDVAARLRQNRGLEMAFQGRVRDIELALWSDLFYRLDTRNAVSIELSGDGPEARGLTIARGESDVLISLNSDMGSVSAPVRFVWRDANGVRYTSIPEISNDGIKFKGSGEELPDFYMFPANGHISTLENANRFSLLSKKKRQRSFVNLFTSQFDWIEDIQIELQGGQPILHASIKNVDEKIPLNVISGAVNRMMSVLLALASEHASVVLVDEIENGIHHSRYATFWKGLVALAAENDDQIFVSTHSEEWLRAVLDETSNLDDVAVWRVERDSSFNQPTIRQFSGEQIKASLEYGGEVR